MFTILAESYFHTLDPYLVRFTEGFGLRWYGLSYAAGFLIAWLVIRWMAKTGRSPLTVPGAADLMFYAIAGVLVGGRLGHVIFYAGGRPLIEFSHSFPYWEVLAINRGGMASHGGMIGVILACWWYAHRRNVPALHLFDLGALTCPVGFLLGRLANFVNAELWGKALPDSMQTNPPWWSVKYPEEILQNGFAHYEAVYRDLWGLIGGENTFLEHVVAIAKDSGHSLHAQVRAALEPLLTAYYPSQIFQSLTDGLLVGLILILLWLKPRKPGVIGAWYLTIYGALRIVTEVFRQPDAGVGLWWGLSRGQALSAVMVIVGLILLAWCTRREVEPLGGLRNAQKS